MGSLSDIFKEIPTTYYKGNKDSNESLSRDQLSLSGHSGPLVINDMHYRTRFIYNSRFAPGEVYAFCGLALRCQP